MKSAEEWAKEAETRVRESMASIIAHIVQRAIEAERERCAKIVDDHVAFAAATGAMIPNVSRKIREGVEVAPALVKGRCKNCNEPVPAGFLECNGNGSHRMP